MALTGGVVVADERTYRFKHGRCVEDGRCEPLRCGSAMLIAAQIAVYLGLLITLGSGLLLSLKPGFLASMGLVASTPAGTSELRALGGMMIGLAIATFLSGGPAAYGVLAAGWTGVTALRLVSIPVDHATLRDVGSSIVVDSLAAVCFWIGAIYL